MAKPIIYLFTFYFAIMIGFRHAAKSFADKAARRLKMLISNDDVTLVMTVSQREYANMLCDRGIVLDKGKVAFDGPFTEAIEYYDKNIKKPAAAKLQSPFE